MPKTRGLRPQSQTSHRVVQSSKHPNFMILGVLITFPTFLKVCVRLYVAVLLTPSSELGIFIPGSRQ